MCPLLWKVQASTNTIVPTIFHELAHFTKYADAADLSYNATYMKQQAQIHPSNIFN